LILFCDTSALVKLYIVEPQSDQMNALVAEAEAVAVVRIAWAEFHAALARRAREVPADAPAVDDARRALAEDWTHYLILEVGQSLVERAGEFADAFALRGYDAVQLAAAHELATEAERLVAFACADQRLARAAKILGLDVPLS
jgi:predicted nucleic acid-binding protein